MQDRQERRARLFAEPRCLGCLAKVKPMLESMENRILTPPRFSPIGGIAPALRGTDNLLHAVEAATGQRPEPAFGGGTAADVERACALAWRAFDAYRETTPEVRAAFLEACAQAILDIADELITRAMAESGLPRGRLKGERGRTVGQLRLFAPEVRDGTYLGVRIDPALPDRTPLPRPDPRLRLRMIPVGTVAVLGASDFPLAYSVGGGDTASALVAGCPVVVKAHSAHPGTSELVGQGLVADPRIKAVDFTSSRAGGTALMKTAAARPEPIPAYAEMSSIKPVFLLPEAMAARASAIGKAFIGSLTLGAGQFCTNPGLVLALDGPGLDTFLTSATDALAGALAQRMLTLGILDADQRGVAHLASNNRVRKVASGQLATAGTQGEAALFEASAAPFLEDPVLGEEVFGAASLVIRCPGRGHDAAAGRKPRGAADRDDPDGRRRRRHGAAAPARAGAARGPHPGQGLPHGRGGQPRHGAWRPVHGRWPLHLRRHAGDRAVPAPGLLSGRAGGAAPRRPA
ncbi:aldehyde dehydrogenase family protein [Teichococcus coralli]